jgi:hypothetical protein
MTVVAASLKGSGLLSPAPSSNAVSSEAGAVRRIIEDAWQLLADSLSVSNTASAAIGELKQASELARTANWDGYGARPIDRRAYEAAIRFLQALPTTTPVPDVGVDPDGEVDVLWHVDPRTTFSVSIGPLGRLTYSGLYGDVQSYGTEWFFNEIPQAILLNLSRISQIGG